MSFGLEVFASDGEAIFSIGYKYMYPMGEVAVPEKKWITSNPGSFDWPEAEGIFYPAAPEGELVWVLSTLGIKTRPAILEYRQESGFVFYRAKVSQRSLSPGTAERTAYGFSFQWGIYV